MQFTWAEGGLAAALGRFANPPSSTRTLLASTNAALESDFPPSTVPLPVPSADWALRTHEQFGAWGLYLLLSKWSSKCRGAADSCRDGVRSLALAWRGDQLGIYASGAQTDGAPDPALPPPETASVWRIDFVDEATAAAVAELARPALGASNVVQQGVRVILARTSGTLPMAWAFAPQGAD